MQTLIIQIPASLSQGRPVTIELGPGQEVTFGRGHENDIALCDPGVSRLAGRIKATEDHWLLTNASRHRTYVVENPEGGGEFIKIAPRRLDAPVPFEFSRVVLPAALGSTSFLVYAPLHAYAEAHDCATTHGEPTSVVFPMDETAKYFLILVALCEPRLRDNVTAVIPTVPEIIERLCGLAYCRNLTRSAVNFHIDYLARTKLRVKESTHTGRAAKADWQRAALVSLALRFDLVREEHLALLPSRDRLKPAGDQST